MTESDMQNNPGELFVIGKSVTGRVKWFNNKAGYGFITVTCDNQTHDIFVHHSAINVNQEQYKYLVQGEYVSFVISCVENTQYNWQASNVVGLNGGKLMCETRRENRKSRISHEHSHENSNVKSNNKTPHMQIIRRQSFPVKNHRPVQARGVNNHIDNSEWMIVRRNLHVPQHLQHIRQYPRHAHNNMQNKSQESQEK